MTRAKSEILQELPFLHQLINMAKRYIDPDKIVIFGSRARGDHSQRSDVDIGFYLARNDHPNWSRFVLDAEDELKTLLEMDLVDVTSASEDLKKSIMTEGVVIYEKKK